MSNNESFIEEVTEEVRRDQLFKMMRRYGWIAILLVIMLVAGAAVNEYRKAQHTAQAQAAGDNILSALANDSHENRIAALAEIDDDGQAAALVSLLIAADSVVADDRDNAVAALETVLADQSLPVAYGDMARFKLLLLQGTTTPTAERRSGFEDLATAGAAFRLLAEEQLALIDLEEGNKDAAIAGLQALLIDSEATAGLRRRSSQLIVALGGDLSET